MRELHVTCEEEREEFPWARFHAGGKWLPEATADEYFDFVSAWAGDGWIEGACSSAAPGFAQLRSRYAESIDDKLLIAGDTGTIQQ